MSNTSDRPVPVGLDIGGANLKFANRSGLACTIAFPLWQQPELLAEELKRQLVQFAPYSKLAVTMTGELADCYATKEQGVNHILTAVEDAAGTVPVDVWQTAGEFVDSQTARECWELTAAANWHALATWAARSTGKHETGLLIDAGSTTVDIIPLRAGLPDPQGRTDLTRLASGELVYTGGRRTPLIALGPSVTLADSEIPLASELFATTQDIHLICGNIPEQPESNDTADGRPADKPHAFQRLARMLCSDAVELGELRLKEVADQLVARQRQQLITATSQVLERQNAAPQQLIISGSASFLAFDLHEQMSALRNTSPIVLTEHLGSEIASAACAYAVAQLVNDE
ncbi:H4MPT-linked C1 transfer pathway protein [bacterium]|nr:H4MPT-linked C1 transfer pathway protein [bacterium]